MKRKDLSQLIREEIKKALSENNGVDPQVRLKSGDYNSVEEFVELWREEFKSTNTIASKKRGFELTLGRPLTSEEFQALDSAGLVGKEDNGTNSFQEDHHDLIQDLTSALGKGNALRTVSNYLGRMLSKSEIRALIASRVINPRIKMQ
jgi:hypothetical protein